MIGMLKRYASECKWPIYFATEAREKVPEEILPFVQIIEVPEDNAGFLDSRAYALGQLHTYTYCLPLQDDFILEGRIDVTEIAGILTYMDLNPRTASARLMPCPGPKGLKRTGIRGWTFLEEGVDEYGFTFQATLWRLADLESWFTRITGISKGLQGVDRRHLEISVNIAENGEGQREFWKWSAGTGRVHIAFNRAGPWSNAVYLSPFPYRPTAIVRGALEGWAVDLAKREGFKLNL